MDTSDWQTIGTVVGNTSTGTYSFVLKSMQSRLGDIVACKIRVPHADRSDLAGKQVIVWGRITAIDRFNPFFPYEAAQELAEESISFRDTVLSSSRDQLQADVLILGMSGAEDEEVQLAPLTYPVAPAGEVLYPSGESVRTLLTGAQTDPIQLRIGSLIARDDVEVSLSGNKIVSRHLAVLAMTGGGKTVAVRRIVRELIAQKYPLVIFDPHGDYLGLYEKQDTLGGVDVKLMYPSVRASKDYREVLHNLIEKMGIKLTDPQAEFLNYLINNHDIEEGQTVKSYINNLTSHASNIRRKKRKNEADIELDIQARTMSVVIRCLEEVSQKLFKMENNNKRLRDRFPQFSFDEMPDPIQEPEQIVNPGQVSILYLAGYDHITQSAIISIVLEALFNHRSELTDSIAPFQVVVEEAHNFIPSRSEGTSDTPSLATIRKLITEGRKFGTGLILVSQRPSRLDETTLSQCNSFLVLRLVNPKDQNFVRTVMENLSESDSTLLPTFGPGQGLVSGQAVRFPLLVKIDFDAELVSESVGDEDFMKRVHNWSPSPTQKARVDNTKSVERITSSPGKRGGR